MKVFHGHTDPNPKELPEGCTLDEFKDYLSRYLADIAGDATLHTAIKEDLEIEFLPIQDLYAAKRGIHYMVSAFGWWAPSVYVSAIPTEVSSVEVDSNEPEIVDWNEVRIIMYLLAMLFLVPFLCYYIAT